MFRWLWLVKPDLWQVVIEDCLALLGDIAFILIVGALLAIISYRIQYHTRFYDHNKKEIGVTMGILGFFKSIGGFFTNLFKKFDSKKVEAIARQILTLADHALPAVEIVAKLTATNLDDTVVLALKNLNLTAIQILDSKDEIFKDGARLALAAEILKLKLFDYLQRGGKIDIGGTVLDTASAALKIDKNVLRSAANSAYAIYRLARN